MDSDDVWNRDKVEKQIAYMCTHPDAVALYTDAEEFVTFGVEHVSYLKRHALLRDADNLMEAMVACDIPLRSTVTVRRKFLDQAWNQSRPSCAADWTTYKCSWKLWGEAAVLTFWMR